MFLWHSCAGFQLIKLLLILVASRVTLLIIGLLFWIDLEGRTSGLHPQPILLYYVYHISEHMLSWVGCLEICAQNIISIYIYIRPVFTHISLDDKLQRERERGGERHRGKEKARQSEGKRKRGGR